MSTTVKFNTAPSIAISGTGIAYGTFDAASYSLSIKGKGKTGPKAKAATRMVQDTLYRTIESLKTKGITIVPGKTRSTLTIEKDYERNHTLRIFSGYTATFNLTFRSRDLNRIGEIHDALTSIVGAEVESPKFIMDPTYKEKLRQNAFEQAVIQAKQRFIDQCKLFQINPEHYEITSWSTQTDRNTYNNFKGLSNFSPLETDEDFFIPSRPNVESGESRVKIDVTVQYNKIT